MSNAVPTAGVFYDFWFAMTQKERSDFAKKAVTTPKHLQNVAYGYAPMGPKLCVKLEQVSGGRLTRPQLRPDDFHEIWPELTHLRADALCAEGEAGHA